MSNIVYTKISKDRAREFQIKTHILIAEDGTKTVQKLACGAEAEAHVSAIYDHMGSLQQEFSGSQLVFNRCKRLENGGVELEFVKGVPLRDILNQELEKSTEAFYTLLDQIVKKMHSVAKKHFEMTEGFAKVFGEFDFDKKYLCAPINDIDLIFDNILVDGEIWNVIDYEWTFDFPIPMDFIIYRSFCYFTDSMSHDWLRREIFDHYGIDEITKAKFDQMEVNFQSYVRGNHVPIKDIHCAFHRPVYVLEDASGFFRAQHMNTNDLSDGDEEKRYLIMLKEAAENELNQCYDVLQSIEKSASWRITRPLRDSKKVVKRMITRLKNPKGYRKSSGKSAGQVAQAKLWNNTISFREIPKQESLNKSIAVHLHLYYEDLLDEFMDYFSNIPWQFDLFISCQKSADISHITTEARKLPHVSKVDVRGVDNHGRDIAPLYVVFRPEIERYDYFLHVHSKKSLHSGRERKGWRQFSMDNLVGSEAQVRRVFSLFEHQNAGLIYPDVSVEIPMLGFSWFANEDMGKAFLNKLGVKDLPNVFLYPAGSFFWARTEALRPIFDQKLSYDDFDLEAGQTDGTFAHALERILPFVSHKAGYHDYIMDVKHKTADRDITLKPFRAYFNWTKENFAERLAEKDIISFDIFDTLITRRVFASEDLFLIMQQELSEKHGLTVDFVSIRNEAQKQAVEEKKAYATIYDIYDVVAKCPEIGEVLAQELLQRELSLELELAVPRREMLEVYENLRTRGKQIILVCDSYLPSDFIIRLLEQCGYTGFSDLYNSCEIGFKKGDGTIWAVVFGKYVKNDVIHVGDDFRADAQIPGMKRVESEAVLSPRDMLYLSPFNCLSKYALENLNNSQLMGEAINNGVFNSPFAFHSGSKGDMKSLEDLEKALCK